MTEGDGELLTSILSDSVESLMQMSLKGGGVCGAGGDAGLTTTGVGLEVDVGKVAGGLCGLQLLYLWFMC